MSWLTLLWTSLLAILQIPIAILQFIQAGTQLILKLSNIDMKSLSTLISFTISLLGKLDSITSPLELTQQQNLTKKLFKTGELLLDFTPGLLEELTCLIHKLKHIKVDKLNDTLENTNIIIGKIPIEDVISSVLYVKEVTKHVPPAQIGKMVHHLGKVAVSVQPDDLQSFIQTFKTGISVLTPDMIDRFGVVLDKASVGLAILDPSQFGAVITGLANIGSYSVGKLLAQAEKFASSTTLETVLTEGGKFINKVLPGLNTTLSPTVGNELAVIFQKSSKVWYDSVSLIDGQSQTLSGTDLNNFGYLFTAIDDNISNMLNLAQTGYYLQPTSKYYWYTLPLIPSLLTLSSSTPPNAKNISVVNYYIIDVSYDLDNQFYCLFPDNGLRYSYTDYNGTTITNSKTPPDNVYDLVITATSPSAFTQNIILPSKATFIYSQDLSFSYTDVGSISRTGESYVTQNSIDIKLHIRLYYTVPDSQTITSWDDIKNDSGNSPTDPSAPINSNVSILSAGKRIRYEYPSKLFIEDTLPVSFNSTTDYLEIKTQHVQVPYSSVAGLSDILSLSPISSPQNYTYWKENHSPISNISSIQTYMNNLGLINSSFNEYLKDMILDSTDTTSKAIYNRYVAIQTVYYLTTAYVSLLDSSSSNVPGLINTLTLLPRLTPLLSSLPVSFETIFKNLGSTV